MTAVEFPLFVILIVAIVALSIWFGWELHKRQPPKVNRHRMATLIGAMRGTAPDYGWGDWVIAELAKKPTMEEL